MLDESYSPGRGFRAQAKLPRGPKRLNTTNYSNNNNNDDDNEEEDDNDNDDNDYEPTDGKEDDEEEYKGNVFFVGVHFGSRQLAER